MKKSAETKTSFKFLYAYLLVRRVQPNPVILSAQETALQREALTRYNIRRVDLKTFRYSAWSKSRSIENTVVGPRPKRLLFSMIKITDFNGSVDTNPYKFRHYDISEFSMYVIGRRVPSKGLSLDMDHEKRLSWGIGTL